MSPIIVHEVGPRDGLQMEPQTVPLEQKIASIEDQCASSIDILQIGFVCPSRQSSANGRYRQTLRPFRRQPEAGTRNPVGLVLNEKRAPSADSTAAWSCSAWEFPPAKLTARKKHRHADGEATDRIIAMAREVIRSRREVPGVGAIRLWVRL